MDAHIEKKVAKLTQDFIQAARAQGIIFGGLEITWTGSNYTAKVDYDIKSNIYDFPLKRLTHQQ